MARGWFGFGLLILFLILGFVVAVCMDNAHLPTGELLEQAAEKTLTGQFVQAVELATEAKSRWDRHWHGTATVADHAPMDDVDALFGELEIYARTEEAPHFAAVCKELSQRIQAMADAHRFRLWNIL